MTGGLFAGADPLGGLAGGVLIGLAGALLLLGAGRIAGVSGIVARGVGLGGASMGRMSAWLFLVGLPLGAALAMMVSGKAGPQFGSTPMLIVAGLLVGFGTRLGSGCTSGHGVCGVSRLSRRSVVATLVFISSGMATVAVMRLAGL